MLDPRSTIVCDPDIRLGRPSVDDVSMHLRLLHLLPYTVHVNHDHERAAARAVALSLIPSPRQPIDLRPAARTAVAPRGVPARPHTQWGKR